MPFALCNAAQTFQHLTDIVLWGLEGVFVYLDDILVATRDETSHRHLLWHLFGWLEEHGLAVHSNKCDLGKTECTFLGHQVSPTGIKPLPNRVQAIWDFPSPRDRTSLQEFLGLINYYHRFLPRVARILAPLNTSLPKSAGSFFWTDEKQNAFDYAKKILANVTMRTILCVSFLS